MMSCRPISVRFACRGKPTPHPPPASGSSGTTSLCSGDLPGDLADFQQATQRAGHGWKRLDLSLWLGHWLARHEFFEALAAAPRELRGLVPDIEASLVDTLRGALAETSTNDVLAVDGCGSLFGILRVSSLLDRVAVNIPGRLLLGFPGSHATGIYRLLDARDGWNYHATPVPSGNAF